MNKGTDDKVNITQNMSAPANLEQQENFSASDLLRSGRFRMERESHWRRLDELVTYSEKKGMTALSYQEVSEITHAYRQTMNSLSVARDISLDQALIEYLENLCSRAYLVIYAPQESLVGLVVRLFSSGIPQAVRRSYLPLLLGFLALILGAVLGYTLYFQEVSWFYTLVSPSVADGRTPDASTAYLTNTLYNDASIKADRLTTFASMLFTHNTRIAIFIFSLGVFLILPSFVLTFYNGLFLGAFYALFADRGLGFDLFAWLSIHGVTELAAIAIACAGGARLGLAVLLPGQRTRRDALRHQAHDAVKLAILAALMLVVAALLEGFLRQMIHDPIWRIIIGWGMGGIWLAWLLLVGRTKGQATTGQTRKVEPVHA